MSTTTERFSGILIFIVVFLGIFVLFVSFIPVQLIYSGKSYVGYEIPSYFDDQDIQTIKYFMSKNWTGSDVTFDFNTASPATNQVFRWRFTSPLFGSYMILARRTWSFWVFEQWEQMQFEEIGEQIHKNDMLSHWDADKNASIFYPVHDGMKVKVWFVDRDQQRNNIGAAWDTANIRMGIGFGFEGEATVMSAWDIVGRLLLFQAPEITGLTGPAGIILTAVIALPFLACVAYLVFRFVRLIFPF